MKKQDLLYEGKAKKVYRVQGHPEYYIMEFKDDLTAFNGEKYARKAGKGELNNKISAEVFQFLARHSIANHFIDMLSSNEMLVLKTDIIPIEVVVRNIASGSLVKRLGLAPGDKLQSPVLEFYYKRDDLQDPMINRHHIRALNLAKPEALDCLEEMAFSVNDILTPFFQSLGLSLVDFKLEFGRHQDGIILADEITPDTCRLWDLETGESLDKDVFRYEDGDVLSGYREVYRRITEGRH